jgi:hypothetical protein
MCLAIFSREELQLLNGHFFGVQAEGIKHMNRRPWINRYGTVAVLVMLLLVMNPELRS